MRHLLLLCFLLLLGHAVHAQHELWQQIVNADALEMRPEVQAQFIEKEGNRVLQLSLTKKAATNYAWCTLWAPEEGWDLDRAETVEARVTNTGQEEVKLMLWVKASKGWDVQAHEYLRRRMMKLYYNT